MAHDATKVLMGSVGSNEVEVISKKGAIAAGIAVRLKNDDTLSTVSSDGQFLGVSRGEDLSDTDKTAIVVSGLMVPIQLTESFNPVPGAVVNISNTTGLAVTSGGTDANAVYRTGRIGGNGVNAGIAESGANVGVAYIDFPGGL